MDEDTAEPGKSFDQRLREARTRQGLDPVPLTTGQEPPDVSALADATAILQIAPYDFHLGAERLLGTAGNDVDDTVHCVRAPQCPSGPANHLNTINVFECHIVLIPEDPGVDLGVDASTVDQNQHLVGIPGVEATGGDGPSVGVDLSHLHSGDNAEELWQAVDS